MPSMPSSDALKQITHLAAALKAPRITDTAARLAEHARDAGWTFEEYLAAVLDREVSARNASGAELRIRAAGFGGRKTIDEFDFDHQPASRSPLLALASGAYLAEHRNIVLLGPPGTGKTHLATGGESRWSGVGGDDLGRGDVRFRARRRSEAVPRENWQDERRRHGVRCC